MSFRKRLNIVPSTVGPSLIPGDATKAAVAGTRPSPLDGRLTISTGTHSLDSLLSGHAGLPLGTSMFVEENGTTDFGGTFLRYFAAEGIAQGHHVHVLGVNEGWGRELPGLAASIERPSSENDELSKPGEKMKIAWRYDRLGNVGRDFGDKANSSMEHHRFTTRTPFCHDFDLSKRLSLPSPSLLNLVSQSPQSIREFEPNGVRRSPFADFLQHLVFQLSNYPAWSIHRIVIHSLLSPAAYLNTASAPENVLQFLHSLRALLRKHPNQLAAIVTLPLSLYPRTTGLTRWMEILNDGVFELAPFPYPENIAATDMSKPNSMSDDLPQGMLKVHRLPIVNEKGGGIWGLTSVFDDMTFNLRRRRGLVIKPFSLPPVDASSDDQYARSGEHGKLTKSDIEF